MNGGEPLTHPMECKLFIAKYVEDWSKKYRNIVKYMETLDNGVHKYKVIFSKPEADKPVPLAVVHVYFLFDTMNQKMTYQFENSNLVHRPNMTVKPGKMEIWLDRYINDKLAVRVSQDLLTPFEDSRMNVAQKSDEDDSEDDSDGDEDDGNMMGGDDDDEGDSDDDVAEEDVNLIGGKRNKTTPPDQLLVRIFDSADEDGLGELPYLRVAELLFNAQTDLSDWDLRVLLAGVEETPEGTIKWRDFVYAASAEMKIVAETRKRFIERRIHEYKQAQTNAATKGIAFSNDTTNDILTPLKGLLDKDGGFAELVLPLVHLVYGEEFLYVVPKVLDELSRQDPSAGEVGVQPGMKGKDGVMTAAFENVKRWAIPRNVFRQALMDQSQFLSQQELDMIMQTIIMDEDGLVCWRDFAMTWVEVRRDAKRFAIRELDTRDIVQQIKLVAGDKTGHMVRIYECRRWLERLRLLRLSRMEIHVILTLLPATVDTMEVDFKEFVLYAAALIKHFYTPDTLVKAARLRAQENADKTEALANANNAQTLGNTITSTARVEEEDSSEGAEIEVNMEAYLRTITPILAYQRKPVAYTTFVDWLRPGGKSRPLIEQSAPYVKQHDLQVICAEADPIEQEQTIMPADVLNYTLPCLYVAKYSPLYRPLIDLLSLPDGRSQLRAEIRIDDVPYENAADEAFDD